MKEVFWRMSRIWSQLSESSFVRINWFERTLWLRN